MTTNMKIALITGANKGIGLEIARQLAQLGHGVLIGARDAQRGESAAKALQLALPAAVLRGGAGLTVRPQGRTQQSNTNLMKRFGKRNN